MLPCTSVRELLIDQHKNDDWIPKVFLHALVDSDAHKLTLNSESAFKGQVDAEGSLSCTRCGSVTKWCWSEHNSAIGQNALSFILSDSLRSNPSANWTNWSFRE